MECDKDTPKTKITNNYGLFFIQPTYFLYS